ncbi:Immunoglobulin domain-containing protein [Cyclonatronum proteinivorum]|uniref:Immunoglobulin domain-containing protein n=1 Tax=Cyclonatronum proteinivorum TaxID=1457365 RepID=A0A345UKJ1_9BACT|nr:immunoglobulin domain-containing protein [Cyclonatronum proteinivorum]AXJ00993.1 Immunoglobulin domain-containing protein [Cyclonatronum proteinivorum]
MVRYFLFVALFCALCVAPAQGQYVSQSLPHEGAEHSVQPGFWDRIDLGLGARLMCSADGVLQDAQSQEALRQYRELRRLQPEGALTEALHADAALGDTRNFRVRNLTNNTWRTLGFTLRGLSDEIRIWVENGEFAPDKVNEEVIEGLLEVMSNSTPALSIDPERGIIEIGTEVFGNMPNIDGSGILNILITDVIDGWTPGSTRGFVAGFFDPVDLVPDNSNSNAADIIYLNSRPLIYNEGQVNALRVRSVAAHELQHLIHANYGGLHIFQNEGQSEWAELLTGFPGRSPSYLSDPLEIDQELYTWRRNSPEVLIDYQRASLLHSYLFERFGPEATGALTRSSGGRLQAYEALAAAQGLSFEEILRDFHIANFINLPLGADTRFSYGDIRRRANRVTFPTFQYFSGQTEASRSATLFYGGAEYSEFIGVENLNLTISGSDGVHFAVIGFPEDVNLDPEVMFFEPGSYELPGPFERVVLTAVAVTPPETGVPASFLADGMAADLSGEGSGGSVFPLNAPTLSFSYSASWQTLPIVTRTLSYAGQPTAFAELPGDQRQESRRGIRKLAKRFSPELPGRITEVGFTVNGRDSSLVGGGDLRISLHTVVGSTSGPVPGTEIEAVTVPLNQLVRGANSINLSAAAWTTPADGDFFIVFEVLNPASRVEFLLDGGSNNASDSNYFPVRTRLFIEPPSADPADWFRYTNRNNLLASVRISGSYEGPVEAPEITRQPVSGTVVPGGSFTLEVAATGTPEPVYQWFKDGLPLYDETGRMYQIDDMDTADEGIYTVRVSNPGGSVLSSETQVLLRLEDFTLSQNFPNPFRQSTTISFILPEEAVVGLTIHDVQGRLVGTVLSGELLQPGIHEYEWESRWMANGLFFYRIHAEAVNSDERFTKARKMIRLR